MPKYSKVNPNLAVTESNWVVSLIRTGNHALIAVESVGFGGTDEGLCIRWFDFIPKHLSRFHSRLGQNTAALFSGIKNSTKEGVVRYCKQNGGDPLINVSDTMTKKDLFSQFHWSQDTDSWQVEPSKVKQMLEDIRNDMENDCCFQIKGGPDGLNCVTWAWKKLEKAEIDARNKNIHNIIGIKPNHNIGSRRKDACSMM